MQDFVLNLLDRAVDGGAAYADVRAVEQRTERLFVQDNQAEPESPVEDTGYAVRLLLDGAWGFAASSEFSIETGLQSRNTRDDSLYGSNTLSRSAAKNYVARRAEK